MPAFAKPPATPVPGAPAPTTSLYEGYDPVGALQGMFAPAYLKGFQPSSDAVMAWQKINRGVTPDIIEQSRMPALWTDPTKGITAVEGGPPTKYGEGRIPDNPQLGDQRGMVDPAALRAAAMGGPYDLAARRNAIAARVLENQNLQAQAESAKAQAAAQQQQPLQLGMPTQPLQLPYYPSEYQND